MTGSILFFTGLYRYSKSFETIDIAHDIEKLIRRQDRAASKSPS